MIADASLTALRQLTQDAKAEFRSGQLEAIQAVRSGARRALVVQRTGWGKSAVYFIATKLLRDEGRGPTVIVSPLLALMRNQIEAATRLGLSATSVNSTNTAEWERVFDDIDRDEVDVLLISPERLSNEKFRTETLPQLLNRMGLLVIDEAHCISDWGHDFRPSYRRLEQIAASLPPSTPILCTTATANDRVVADIKAQLGSDITIVRGPLDRPSLQLQVIEIPNKAQRMAWLAQHIPDLAGSGIVYTLTIADANRTAGFLRSCGIDARSYTGPTDEAERLETEALLTANRLKVVVATSALAMGYDNPFITFVIHFQVPGSAISYYQQVGRAGRAVQSSYGIALAGAEDKRIQDYFIDTAFPSEEVVAQIMGALADNDGLRKGELLGAVNIRSKRLDAALELLEVEGAIYKQGPVWYRSAEAWPYPKERFDQITVQRKKEQDAMALYVSSDTCLMEQLRGLLDDPSWPCGRCANCVGKPLVDVSVDTGYVDRALAYLAKQEIWIEPRKQKPAGVSLSLPSLERGRALSVYGEVPLGQLVHDGKYVTGRFDDQLLDASVRLIQSWLGNDRIDWLTSIPDRVPGGLIESFAQRLAERLGAPYELTIARTGKGRPQKEMENSALQARNAIDKFTSTGQCGGSVLLVDDIIDSGWTTTVIADLLRKNGAETVIPFGLAHAGQG